MDKFKLLKDLGYDGVDLFAPASVYGGPEALRRLVDAAHRAGLGILLDVVYNHLGPDGNYLRQFSNSYFTDRHQTPWGEAINYDGPASQPVRAFVLENAARWLDEFRDDLKYAVRQLKSSPAFTLVATLTLALGIGANSAIFALVDATLLRPLPFREPDRLVAIWERSPTTARGYVSPLNMLDWSARSSTFEKIAGFTPASPDAAVDDLPTILRVVGALASGAAPPGR